MNDYTEKVRQLVDDIKAKKYSLAAGQYFDIKIVYSEKLPEEFQRKITGCQRKLNIFVEQGKRLEDKKRINIINTLSYYDY
jgi:uncharacterized UPF0146 family protein